MVWGGTQASTAPGAFGGGPVGTELEAGVELEAGAEPNKVVSDGAWVVLGCFAFGSPTGLVRGLDGVAQTMSGCPRCCCEALARGTGDLGTDGSLRVALVSPRVAWVLTRSGVVRCRGGGTGLDLVLCVDAAEDGVVTSCGAGGGGALFSGAGG